MKRLVVYMIIIFNIVYLPLQACAVTNTQLKEVSKIENSLFGYDYGNESISTRLSRLETNIYGKTNNGKLENRLKKIFTDMNSEQIGQEIPPVEDTFIAEEAADSTVNYPIVDEIELKLFNQTYKNRDFHTRIVTIERKLFGKIYDVDDYATRMDRIKAEIMPARLAEEKVFGESKGYDYSNNAITSSSLSSLGNNRYSTMPYGQENYTRPYSNYGEYGYDSGMYNPPQDIEEQLAQLEYDTFGTEFSNESTQKRMKRLESVNKAQKSSHKYDSQQFNNRMSTFMEIGSILLMILAMVL